MKRLNQCIIEGKVVDLNDDEYVLEYSASFKVRVVIADNFGYPDIDTDVRVVGYLCEEGIQEEHRECKASK